MKQRLCNWIWCLAGVLLCLTMLSFRLTGGLYARYTTTVTASDSARVAKYQISVASSTANSLALVQDTDVAYTFSVSSSSEVSVEYDLIVTLPKALPSGVTISLEKGEEAITHTQVNNVYTAINAGTFTPQGGTHNYSLVFTATQPIGADALEGISIQVNARQVD